MSMKMRCPAHTKMGAVSECSEWVRNCMDIGRRGGVTCIQASVAIEEEDAEVPVRGHRQHPRQLRRSTYGHVSIVVDAV